MRRRLSWAIAVFMLLGLSAAPAVAQGTGGISGDVTNADTSAGLSGITVYVYNSAGGLAKTVSSTAGGSYTAKNLAAGTYYLETYNSLGYVDELYSDIQCLGLACSNPTSGTAVTVLSGTETPGIDFALSPGGSIAGTVTDDVSGLPLAGVSVFAYDAGNNQLRGATTDGSGWYRIDVLPKGTYYVKTYNSLGYVDELFDDIPCALGSCPAASAGEGVDVSPGSTTEDVDFGLVKGGTISGSVTNAANGAPIASGWVYIYSAAGSFLGSAPISAGAYTRPLLTAGTYYLRTSNTLGFVDEVYDDVPCMAGICPSITTGTPVVVATGVTVSGIDFGLTLGGTINGSVQVAGSGAPIPGVTVYIGNAAGTIVTNATTDAVGNYTKAGLSAGTYYVKTYNNLGYIDELYNNILCEAAMCSMTSGAPVNVLAGSPINGIDFTLDFGGSITGTVTNANTGAPLASVQVRAYHADGTMGATSVTNASGVYTIGGLIAGIRHVRTYNNAGWVDELYNDIVCPGSSCPDVTTGTPILVSPGLPTGAIDFGLVRGGTITGTVTADGTGTPLAGMWTYFYDADGKLVSGAATNASGEYTKAGLPKGLYRVGTFNLLGYIDELYDGLPCPGAACDATAGAEVTVEADVTTPGIDFALKSGGRIAGTVRDSEGTLPGVRIAVYDASGAMVGKGGTDSEGFYTTTAMPDGAYYVQTVDTDGYVDEVYDNLPCTGGFCPDPTTGTAVPVTIEATTPGIDFTLGLAGSISGTVWNDAATEPLIGVSVLVYNSTGLLVANAMTNGTGAFTVTNLVSGTHYVRTVNSLGYVDEFFTDILCPLGACPATTSSTPVWVTGGATTPGITFWLSQGGSITGTVANGVTTEYLAGVDIGIYDSAGLLLGSDRTDDSGVFMLTPLPAGNYYLRTSDAPGYLDELYDNLPCPGGVCPSPLTGTAVSVAAGVMTGDIDFRLQPVAPGGAVRSDFTGDLTSDLLWRGTGGDLWLWGIETATHASDAYVGVVADSNWEIRGQGDLDGDGKADLVWRHKLDGTVYYWKMDGPTPAAELYVATVDVSYDIAGTGDFDGDGRADILWRNPLMGDLWLWRMNGAEVLEQSYVDTVDMSYAIKGFGDLNGDLKTDVVWQGAGGDLWAWLMNGATKDAQTYVGTVADGTYQLQQVVDFDADLKADLLWWNTAAGDVWVWRMNGAEVLSEHYVGLVADTHYRIQAAGDYNGDGRADILWRNIVAGDLWVWLMDGPAKASEAYLGVAADQGYQVVR